MWQVEAIWPTQEDRNSDGLLEPCFKSDPLLETRSHTSARTESCSRVIEDRGLQLDMEQIALYLIGLIIIVLALSITC